MDRSHQVKVLCCICHRGVRIKFTFLGRFIFIYDYNSEAIETRHALHGVRWPVSNPKFLNVDFGSRTDMDRAIQSTKNETPKYPQDNTRDNQHAGNTWSRLDASEKKVNILLAS